MENDYLVLLQARENTIFNLAENNKRLKDALYISDKQEHDLIIKEWKLKADHVRAVRKMTTN